MRLYILRKLKNYTHSHSFFYTKVINSYTKLFNIHRTIYVLVYKHEVPRNNQIVLKTGVIVGTLADMPHTYSTGSPTTFGVLNTNSNTTNSPSKPTSAPSFKLKATISKPFTAELTNQTTTEFQDLASAVGTFVSCYHFKQELFYSPFYACHFSIPFLCIPYYWIRSVCLPYLSLWFAFFW